MWVGHVVSHGLVNSNVWVSFCLLMPRLQEAMSEYHEAIRVMVKYVRKIKGFGQNGEIFTVS